MINLWPITAFLSGPIRSIRWRIQDLAKGGPWRARRARAYNGGLGAEPPAGSRAEPLVGGSGGLRPPEAETLFAFERSIEAANSLIFF